LEAKIVIKPKLSWLVLIYSCINCMICFSTSG